MGRPNRFHLAYSADKGGALRNQVYVGGHFRLEDDEAFVIDVNDGGARYFTVPISNVWGTTMGIMRSHRQPQQGPVRAQRRRHLDLRALQRRSRRAQLGRPVRALRGHPHPADGGVPRPAPDRGAGRVGPGGEARRPRVGAPAGHPRGHADGAGRAARRSRRGLRPTPARGRRREPLARSPGCSTGIGRAIAVAALDAGHSVRGHRPPARGGAGPGRRPSGTRGRRRARRHRPRPDRRGGRRGPRRVRRPRRARQQRRVRLPVRGGGGRRRRGAGAVRHQLLRRGRHDQGRAARHARPGRRATSST